MNSTTISSLDPIQDLESLFSKIGAICKQQFAVIHRVFPASACNSTRELLVERLFNDPAFGIFSYLDQFLNVRRESPMNPFDSETSSSDNPGLEYVRLLSAAYEKTCSLASTVESIEIEEVAASQPKPSHPLPDSSENDDNSVPAEQDGPDSRSPDQERMHTFLNLQLHSLFGSHRQRYFRTELDLIQQRFKGIFSNVKFPQQLTPKQKATATKAKSHAVTSVSAANVSAHTQSSVNIGGSSSNFEKDGSGSVPEAASFVFYETLLAIGDDEVVPESYQVAMKESITRCEFILKDTELRADLVTKIFSSFIASFGDEYLGVRWWTFLLCVSLALADALCSMPDTSTPENEHNGERASPGATRHNRVCASVLRHPRGAYR